VKHISSLITLGSLVFWGCGDLKIQSVTAGDVTAVLAVSDGSHDGNTHFFFLPPMVRPPVASGTFDTSLDPEVEICVWDGSICSAVVAQFSAEAGHGSETVRVDPETGGYIVNWHTQGILEDFPLDAGESYRIRVLVGTQVLGWADVWIAPDARTRRTSDDLLLVDGQTLPIKFRIEQGATAEEATTDHIVDALGTGFYHSCAVDASGSAWCWGRNDFGQLGTGSTSNYETTPQRVVGTLSFRAVYAGLYHTCGLTTDGSTYCWGYNYYEQVGAPSSVAEPSPVAVGGGHNFRTLAPGGYFTCGVTTDDAILCWGNGSQGQLGGDAYPYMQMAPTSVAGGLSYHTVTAGQLHACGLATDGALYCWGDNANGQLGVVAGVLRAATPQPVVGGLTFTQVDGGYFSTCAVTGAGAGYCWGHNAYGQVGDGTAVSLYPFSRPSPSIVAGEHTFLAITAGGLHSCGITTAGAAYCWGFNGFGQLGDGTQVERHSPVAVSGGFTFSVLSAGGYHTCGLTTTLDALCWGNNNFGSLGNGTRTMAMEPVTVMGLDLAR